jgi:hypothetical protein
VRKALPAAVALAGGCVSAPSLAVQEQPQPVVCATSRLAQPASVTSLAVAPTSEGAALVWTAGGPVMREPLTPDLAPVLEPAEAWPGSYDAVTASVSGDLVIVGALSGDGSYLLEAPFGYGVYRDLAILGGRVGAPPIATAGGEQMTAAVWYGGLRVNAIDDSWQVRTSQLGVSSAHATELAITAAGREAMIAWPTTDACYIERVIDPANGTGWIDPVACPSPRLASTGRDADVALVYEGTEGVYLARATVADLHATAATLVAPGARAPRIAADGGGYWLGFVDASGAAQAGLVGSDGVLRTTTVAQSALAIELAVVGDEPRMFAVDDSGTTIATLCAE